MMLFHHLTFLMMKTHLMTNCHNFDFFKLYYCPYLQFNFTFCIPPAPSHSLQFVQCAVLPGGPSHSPSPHCLPITTPYNHHLHATISQIALPSPYSQIRSSHEDLVYHNTTFHGSSFHDQTRLFR